MGIIATKIDYNNGGKRKMGFMDMFKKIPVEERTTDQWLVILNQKTTGNFLVGLFLGMGLMIALLALAYLF